MTLILVILLAAGSLILIVYSLVADRLSNRFRLQYRLAGHKNKAGILQPENRAGAAANLKAMAPALAKLVQPKSAMEQNRMKIKLANAGHRGPDTLVFFLAGKIVLGVGGMFLCLFLAGLGG